MIDTLFTDLGEVMFLFNQEQFKEEIVRRTGGIPEKLTWDKSSYHAKAQTGRISGKKYLEKRAQELGLEDPRLLTEIWAQVVTPNEKYFAFLREWKQTGRKLYLLSNINVVAWQYYKDLPIFHEGLFDDLFLSYRMRLMKPNPRIFQTCLDRAKAQARQSIFIDDMSENVESAGKLGMNTWCYYNGTHNVFMDFITPVLLETPRERIE